MDRKYFSFKKLFWSYFFSFMLASLLVGLFALFHIYPIYLNESPKYGIQGFLIALLYIPFFGFIFCCLNWLILNLGCFLYEFYLRKFKIKGE